MRKPFFLALLSILVGAAAAAAPAGEAVEYWPQWRGPHFNGSSSTAHDLPVTWSETENIAWKLDMPSWSAGTPIVWENTVFVTSAQEGFNELEGYGAGGSAKPDTGSHDKLLLLAVDRRTGKIKWRREVGSGNRLYRKQNLSSPSPITDGQRIWIMTGTGELSCWDFAGKEIWRRNIQKDYGAFGLNHGYASTPLLWGDRLYVQVLHGMKTDDPSYVFAVDKSTGKTIWKVDRPTDAPNESPDDYSTPIVVKDRGGERLIVSGGDYVTGHDLATGKEVWRKAGFNPGKEPFYRTIASSIAIDDILYTTSTRGKPFIAFHAGGGHKELWKNDLGSDVPTPTTDGKIIYVINDRGIAVALDAATGAVIWDRQRIEPGIYSSSPLLADGKIYATSEDGVTTVLAAGRTFKTLATNRLDGHTLSSPIAVGNQIFLRTAKALYCIQKK